MIEPTFTTIIEATAQVAIDEGKRLLEESKKARKEGREVTANLLFGKAETACAIASLICLEVRKIYSLSLGDISGG